MKRRLKILILCAIFTGLLCSQWLQTLTYGAYRQNTAAFTLRYCENLAKPVLKCQGMCHLKKLLAEQAEEKNGSGTPETELTINLYQEKHTVWSVYPPLLWQNVFFTGSSEPLRPFRSMVFHPPTLWA